MKAPRSSVKKLTPPDSPDPSFGDVHDRNTKGNRVIQLQLVVHCW